MHTHHYKAQHWLTEDQNVLDAWLDRIIEEERACRAEHFLPVIEDFKMYIDLNPDVRQLFIDMFKEVPPKFKREMRKQRVTDYEHMLRLFNHIIQRPPCFNDDGLVGCPLNAVIDWPMCTVAGFQAFSNPVVNSYIKNILNYWGTYLESEDSTKTLHDGPGGWLQPHALEEMAKVGYGDTFFDIFAVKNHDPKEHFGYTCWDAFFTRPFKEGARPIADPDDLDAIANACESAPLTIARNVRLMDQFWIKAQPYSLLDIFHRGSWAKYFDGGTLYQAYLSALSYHRWHSPISGTVIAAYNVDGTYFAEDPHEGFIEVPGGDPVAPDNSQRYLAEVAARAILIIEADNKALGKVAFVGIGMAEISGCDITVEVGQHIEKGQEIGMFHYGGSTHCLIFEPGVELDFTLHGEKPGVHGNNIKINETIARLVKGKA